VGTDLYVGALLEYRRKRIPPISKPTPVLMNNQSSPFPYDASEINISRQTTYDPLNLNCSNCVLTSAAQPIANKFAPTDFVFAARQGDVWGTGVLLQNLNAPLQTHAHTPNNDSTTPPKTNSVGLFHPVGACRHLGTGKYHGNAGHVRRR
jgi:hypothetical protein